MARRRSCNCGTCPKCRHADYVRDRYQEMTPEERRELVGRRDPDLAREQDRLKQAKRRREGTPEQQLRISARNEVRKALLRGDLVRQECEVPGCTTMGQAHHDDYNKPLDVRWLCRPHHDEHHREQ